jgi:hypothetical protein
MITAGPCLLEDPRGPAAPLQLTPYADTKTSLGSSAG